MISNISFTRFDADSTFDGYVYLFDKTIKDIKDIMHQSSLDLSGFNIHTRIQNYTGEDVYLSGSLRAEPTRIRSIAVNDTIPIGNHQNKVVITVLSSFNTFDPDGKKKNTSVQKSEIKIPARMLHHGSVFIKELDAYLMTESSIDATRELMARDASHNEWTTINIPAGMVKQNPATTYAEYKPVMKACLKKINRLQVRVGIDLRYGTIPDHIKNLHISVGDSYFIPFTSNKMVYDPHLGPDTFVIENLHVSSDLEYTSTFSDLARQGYVYLDYDQMNTMFGKFYGLAIFSDHNDYIDYVHRKRSQDRFEEETLFVAERSGDPRLREDIEKLGLLVEGKDIEVSELKVKLTESTEEIRTLREVLRKTRLDLKERETTIDRIRSGHEATMRTDAVLLEMVNETKKTENEWAKIQVEAREIDHKVKTVKQQHTANVLKTISDIAKSGWAIVLGSVTAVITLIGLYNKMKPIKT